MTKIHEEYITGTIEEIRLRLADGKTRGEFVVIVHPPGKKTVKPEEDDANYH
jgi:16S rRNA (cytidine1402-2'-O)-methyltransferase